MNTINCTAAALRAFLAFIDPENTPKIAWDIDALAKPLADKVKAAVGDRDGTQRVSIYFNDDEAELKRQFNGVCGNIKSVFDQLTHCSNPS